MSATEHTPGPWIIETQDGGQIRVTDSATEGHTVCVVPSGIRLGIKVPDLAEEQRANARLIATAPELLVALRELVSRAEYTAKTGYTLSSGVLDGIERAKVAITKAGGLATVTLKTSTHAEVYSGRETGRTEWYAETAWPQDEPRARTAMSVLGRGYTEAEAIADWNRRAALDGHSVSGAK